MLSSGVCRRQRVGQTRKWSRTFLMYNSAPPSRTQLGNFSTVMSSARHLHPLTTPMNRTRACTRAHAIEPRRRAAIRAEPPRRLCYEQGARFARRYLSHVSPSTTTVTVVDAIVSVAGRVGKSLIPYLVHFLSIVCTYILGACVTNSPP